MAFPRSFDPNNYLVNGEDRFVTWKDRYNALVLFAESLILDLNALNNTLTNLNDRLAYLESGGGGSGPVTGTYDDGTWMDTVLVDGSVVDLMLADVPGTDDALWSDLMIANPPTIDMNAS